MKKLGTVIMLTLAINFLIAALQDRPEDLSAVGAFTMRLRGGSSLMPPS